MATDIGLKRMEIDLLHPRQKKNNIQKMEKQGNIENTEVLNIAVPAKSKSKIRHLFDGIRL